MRPSLRALRKTMVMVDNRTRNKRPPYVRAAWLRQSVRLSPSTFVLASLAILALAWRTDLLVVPSGAAYNPVPLLTLCTAVACGATMVRVGRALFGPRPALGGLSQ